MSQVLRVWQLGDHEKGIHPTQEAFARLVHILAGQQPTDILWDSTLKVTELVGDGRPNIICGPGIKVTRVGDDVIVAKVEQ